MSENAYYVSLDLGQSADYSALAILERPVRQPVPVHSLRHLQRWPLGTSYVRIADDVAELLKRPPLPGCPILVDKTGCGAPVYDLLADRLNAGLAGRGVAHALHGITITAGSGWSAVDGGFHVAKVELVSALVVCLQTRRLLVARDLPEAAALARELETFRVKLTRSSAETFEAWRESDKDDLVLAAAMACWAAEHDARNFRKRLAAG